MDTHKWIVCEMCGPTIICKTCGNNTCNGGYGTVNGEDCPDCPNAYKLTQDGYKWRLWHPSTFLWQFHNFYVNLRIRLGIW